MESVVKVDEGDITVLVGNSTAILKKEAFGRWNIQPSTLLQNVKSFPLSTVFLKMHE